MNEKMNLFRRFPTFFLVVGLIMIICNIGMWVTYEAGDYPKTVKCYDKYDNEIVGVNCLDESGDTFGGIVGLTFLSFIVIIGGLLIYMIGDMGDEK